MKHVGCYIGEHSGLFKVEHRHDGEKFTSKMRSDVFWIPYTYTLIPINGAVTYYLEILMKESEDAPVEGSKVEVCFKTINNYPHYIIKEHK